MGELWATRVDGRLVVVEADTVLEAQRSTGLIFEGFTVATDAELVEWDELIDEALTADEVEAVLRILRKRQRSLGRQRARARETGRWPADRPAEHDLDLAMAARWQRIAAKLKELAAVDEAA